VISIDDGKQMFIYANASLNTLFTFSVASFEISGEKDNLKEQKQSFLDMPIAVRT
jgi:hypothetical protein